MLRGTVIVTGDIDLLVCFQRIFPGHRGRPRMSDLVSILDGNTFVVSDGRGDIEATDATPPACSRSTPGFCRSGC